MKLHVNNSIKLHVNNFWTAPAGICSSIYPSLPVSVFGGPVEYCPPVQSVLFYKHQRYSFNGSYTFILLATTTYVFRWQFCGTILSCPMYKAFNKNTRIISDKTTTFTDIKSIAWDSFYFKCFVTHTGHAYNYL